jgi:mannonate dehydratase
MIKLGFGLYRHQLTPEGLAFARQTGATHLVVHLVDYFNKAGTGNPDNNQPTGGVEGWGISGSRDSLWTVGELSEIKGRIEAAGLTWYAIENFDPGHWYDILLDGPKRDSQIDDVKSMIRVVGEAGIPVVGYNFSLGGVAARVTGSFARGGATSVGLLGEIDQTPIPLGMIWNMVYDQNAPEGNHPTITRDQLWARLEFFLEEVLPVAEQAGVTLALHPDDPPADMVRSQPRLVNSKTAYDRLLAIRESESNKLEFCLGSLAETPDGSLYDAVDKYSAANRIAYVHFRNVTGRVPHYTETFADDGDIDLLRVMRILRSNDFDGVVIPDHAPLMSCNAPWHAGMAFAMGFMSAALKQV